MSKYNSNVGKGRIKEIIAKEGARVHFIGAGGVGMYSLLRLSEERGCAVSGSSAEPTPLSELLCANGKSIKTGHCAQNVLGADIAVYTLAVGDDNPEIMCAEQNSIPTVSRAEYLGAIMEEYGERIGVSGTHGKSTTTAMLDAIFRLAKKEPTTAMGAIIPGESEPVRIGGKSFFIYEGCEYKDSFLHFSPTAAVLTNLELEHTDYFKDIESLKSSFLLAIKGARVVVINGDDENLRSLLPRISQKCVSFGARNSSDYRVIITEAKNGLYSFKIRHACVDRACISLKIPGKFNVMNAAAAAVLSLELGISQAVVENALSSFLGVERRLQYLGKYRRASVYYDYAHHPTEIENTIRAVKEMHGGRLAVVFKPHTYSRTEAFMNEFVSALSLAELSLICDVSAIREENTHGISSRSIVSKLGVLAEYISDEGSVSNFIDDSFEAVIIMGAANLDAARASFFGK